MIQSRLCFFLSTLLSFLCKSYFQHDCFDLFNLKNVRYRRSFLCNTFLLTLANLLASIYSVFCFLHDTIYRFFRLCMLLLGFLLHDRNSPKFPDTLLWIIFIFFLLFWVFFLLMSCLKGQDWKIADFR